MVKHDDPVVVALLEYHGSLALGFCLLAIHNCCEIPLVARPTHHTIHFDIGICAIHAHLLHARTLLLVNGKIVGPAENRRRPRAVHNGNIVGVILAELLAIPELPCAQHFRQRVINLLFVGQGNQHLGAVRGRSRVGLLFLFFLWRSGRNATQGKCGYQQQENDPWSRAAGKAGSKVLVHSRLTPRLKRIAR